MRHIVSFLLAFLLFTPTSAFAQGLEQHSLTVNLNNAEHHIEVAVPDGWSVSPRPSRNSHTLVNVRQGEARDPTGHVQIFVQPRLDHADALNQISESAGVTPENEKEFLTIGGWPAMQTTQIVQPPSPDKAQRFDPTEVLRVMTYIAAGDVLYIVFSNAPSDAGPELVAELKSIGKSLTFANVGVPEEVQGALDQLRAVQSPSAAALPDKPTRSLDLETTPVNILPNEGANDRIDTTGFGELEIATSPDGVNVVVALQGRLWVSSNDGGATFPNSDTVGAGNGDPSVAWGQSGKFYMAWIDNSGLCTSGYLGGDPAVDPDWIYGIDCTGMARSDDNGVTFDPGLVNPAVICPDRAPDGQPDIPGECFPDQEHIAADRWNPGDTPDDDQVYNTWRNFSPGDQNAALVCSSDSGETWTTPFDIGPGEVFPRITVGPDGSVYVASYAGGNYRLYKYTSCVNGLSLVPGFPVTVGPRSPYRCPFAGHDRCDQNPTSQTVIVDETDPNHVYYAYVLDQEAPLTDTGYSDIIVRDSLNGGLNWNIIGRIARANENVDARRVMPWLCTTGGDAVVTWYEQRGAQPTDATDFYGARLGLDGGGDLVPMEEFVLSEVPDNWCDIGWWCQTRWGNTDVQLSNASEACPTQPQLAGVCGDGNDATPDSGNACDFSDDDGVTFTSCPQAASSPSGNDELCLSTTGGCPKYGDYNGNACAGGKLFAAWASANAPAGLPPPVSGVNPGVLFDVINLDNLGVPVITVPGNVHFGDVCEGDNTQYETLEVCNTGGANLQVDVITSDNPDFAVTVPNSGFPVTISPDFCFPFEVSYTPAGGPETAILTIPSNDPDRPTVEVTADANIGEQNLVTIMDTDYGDICLGDNSSQQLTILNDGTCDLEVDDISITNDPGNEFEIATVMSFPFTLQAGESVSADIEFDPAGDIGPASAQVEIDTDDPDTPTKVLNLTGQSPSTMINTFMADGGSFNAVCAGDISDKNLTIDNAGACPLFIDGVSIVLGANAQAGDFVTPDGNAAGTVVASGNSLQVPIRFAPTAFDNDPPLVREASVDVASRTLLAATSFPIVSTDISGTVPPPNINLAIANSGDFGEVCKGGLTDLDLTLFNQGMCDLTITEISILGDVNGSFILPADLQLPLVLSPDADFTVPVRYAPAACTDIPETAQVRIVSDDPDEPELLVDISGVSPCPNLLIDPVGLTGEYAFPATVMDLDGSLGCYSERTTVLRNNGNCPLTIDSISSTAVDEFTVMAPTVFPVVLPTGEETLEVTVRFTPQSAGDPLAPDEFFGELTVVSDDPDSDHLADLCGEGVAQSGIRVLVTDISSGVPLVVDEVDNITIRSKGKRTPSPINLQFTDVPVQSTSVCGNTVTWHVDQETLPDVQTEGPGPKSSYEASAKEGNLQDSQSFNLGQCEFKEFQLQLRDSDAPACNLLPKDAACTTDGECCSGKCKGPSGGKSCK